ncbi:capsular polysaccharide synthesis protein [Vibrio rumoiensis]|uniref:capsular polysaccharide synthesis protein n=1 Tax=Vibrio rumoiensis TaxID=76258 RepID=UPI003AA7DBD3
MKSDLLRLYLLSQYGGIWADATTFCLNPLSNWLDDNAKHCNIFLFKHEDNNTRPIEVWFIASPKASAIICKTLQSLCLHIF